jgi:hypothetical protein
MQNEFENIPGHIFDWLQKKPFDGLETKDRQEVLAFFSAEEYRAMYDAVRLLGTSAPSRRKEDMMARFDTAHPRGRLVTLRTQPKLWLKAAAILVPFLALAGYALLMDVPENKLMSALVVHDTIFVKGETITDTVVQHDTVYLKARKNAGRAAGAAAVHSPVFTGSGALGAVDVLPIDQLDAASNAVKGNSLKEDSLWLRFEAASL